MTHQLVGVALSEACARAMGWVQNGGKWREPGMITCSSGANAASVTHERVHRSRLLPRFASDPVTIGVMEAWLRENWWYQLADSDLV